MVDIRNALAAALAIGIGLAAVLSPATVLRLQFLAYGADTGRHGEYGGDRSFGGGARWFVRAVGVAALALGVYLATRPFL